MGIIPRAVGTYRERIKFKLGLGSASELIRHAVAWVEQQGIRTGDAPLMELLRLKVPPLPGCV